jgi:hypothetical protein
MAARRPDLFYAYVGTEQIVDMARNEEASYQTILDRSRTAGNASTVKTLDRIGAPPYQRALDWGAKQRAAEVADPAYGRTVGKIQRIVLFSPVYSLKDVSISWPEACFASPSFIHNGWPSTRTIWGQVV